MWALTVTAIILVLALFAAWESRSRLIWWLEVGVNVLTGMQKLEILKRLPASLVFQDIHSKAGILQHHSPTGCV